MRMIHPIGVDVSKKHINIALDWDDTYTADPELWNFFIAHAVDRGHFVYIVTARHKATDPVPTPEGVSAVIYTEGYPKRGFCAAQGLSVDIFIDDAPEGIVNPSARI